MTRLPEDLHRVLRDPTPTNRVTTWTRGPTTRTRSRTETPPHAARPEWQNARAHRRYRLGPGSDGACSRPISSRPAYPSCLNAVPQGRDRPRKRQEFPVDIPAPPCQYRAMLGETQEPILPHPRSAEYMRERKKQFPMCSLRSLTCLQVQILPRQWMVGPRRPKLDGVRQTGGSGRRSERAEEMWARPDGHLPQCSKGQTHRKEALALNRSRLRFTKWIHSHRLGNNMRNPHGRGRLLLTCSANAVL